MRVVLSPGTFPPFSCVIMHLLTQEPSSVDMKVRKCLVFEMSVYCIPSLSTVTAAEHFRSSAFTSVLVLPLKVS